MQLNLSVNGLTFTVSCGEGNQNIKWLGLVAAQRYALMAPHGRCRTREDAHTKIGFYLPCHVKNSEGETLSPWSRISETCRDNDTVTVDLQHEVPLDDVGVPKITEWATSAFSSANNNQNFDEEPSGLENGNDSEKVHNVRAPDRHENLNGYSKSFTSSHVKSGQCISQEELEDVFYHDLPYLKLEEFFKADNEKKGDIEDILLKYYDSLINVYKHYGVCFGEDHYSMNFIEFLHFVHESTLLHHQKDLNVIDKIFKMTTLQAASTQYLSRAGFIQAMIRVIVAQNKMHGDDILFSQALEKSLRECVKPASFRLTAGPFRDHLHSDGIVAIFQEAKPHLAKAYRKYATASSDKVDAVLLSATNLRSMVQDSGIFCTGDSDGHEKLFSDAIDQCFSGMKDASGPDCQLFAFIEFLEVISRLSCAIWKDKDVSVKDMIRIGLDAVRATAKIK